MGAPKHLINTTNNRYTPIVHGPTISLGQKWQRTQVGKKHSCNQWSEATCIKGALVFFFLFFWGGGWGCWICVVPTMFPWSSFYVLIKLAMDSQLVPQHVPNTSSLDPISFALSSTLVTQRRRFKHIYFGIVQILIFKK